MSLFEAWWLKDNSVLRGAHRPEIRRQLSSPDDRLILLDDFDSDSHFEQRLEELLSTDQWDSHVIAHAGDLTLDVYLNGLRVHDKIELLGDFPWGPYSLPKGTFLEVAPGYTHFPDTLYADTRKWPPYLGGDRHFEGVILDCSGLDSQYRRCAKPYHHE